MVTSEDTGMRCGSKTDVTWSPRRNSRSASSRLVSLDQAAMRA